MKYVGCVVLIGRAETGADLAFAAQVLDRITSDSEIKGPLIVRTPLILNPEFLAVAELSVIGIETQEFTHRISGSVICERKEPRFVYRLGSVDLESGLDHMFLTMHVGVIQSQTG
jgi:hypothetical protein